MARRLILDTGVLVEFERRQMRPRHVLGDDDAVVAAISVAELLVGVTRSPATVRDRRRAVIEGMLDGLSVEPYTEAVARVHADLITSTMAMGRSRGAFDLIVAATAIATERTLLTTDAAADFGSLPGLDVRLVGR